MDKVFQICNVVVYFKAGVVLLHDLVYTDSEGICPRLTMDYSLDNRDAWILCLLKYVADGYQIVVSGEDLSPDRRFCCSVDVFDDSIIFYPAVVDDDGGFSRSGMVFSLTESWDDYLLYLVDQGYRVSMRYVP